MGKFLFVNVHKVFKFCAFMCERSQSLEVFFRVVAKFRRLRVVATREFYASFLLSIKCCWYKICKFYPVMCERSKNLEASFRVLAKFRGLRVVATST